MRREDNLLVKSERFLAGGLHLVSPIRFEQGLRVLGKLGRAVFDVVGVVLQRGLGDLNSGEGGPQ